MLGAMPIDGDGDYSEELLREKINSELVGNLSNFFYRVISFTNKNFKSEIKGLDKDKVIDEITERFDVIKKAYEEYNFKKAIDEIMVISSLGNKYFQDNEPWKLIKEDKDRVHKIVGLCINIAKNLSILIQPVLPGFSAELQKQLNVKELGWKDLDFKLENHKIKKAKIIIKKVSAVAEKEIFPLNLKVAKITSVDKHPDADKLYIIKIDVGTEKRQIVASLKDFYTKEELLNKKIVIVANLKKAKLRGVESQGMLLAGEDEKDCGLLCAEKSEPGANIYFEGLENDNKEINFEEFKKIKMVVKNGKIVYKDKVMKTDKEEVKIEKMGEGTRIC